MTDNVTTQNNEMVFYVPGSGVIFDFAIQHEGVYRGRFGGKTIEQAAVENKGITMMTWDDACKKIDAENAARFSDIKEVSEERYEEMLCVMPPKNWISDNGAVSFLLCEPVTCNWYNCFVQYNGKYYEGYSQYPKETSTERHARFIATIKEGNLE